MEIMIVVVSGGDIQEILNTKQRYVIVDFDTQDDKCPLNACGGTLINGYCRTCNTDWDKYMSTKKIEKAIERIFG